GYDVAGKTGTAQKPMVDARGYQPGAFMSTFVGFAPAEDPAVTAIVVINHPQPVYYGAEVAAPVFSEITQYALRMLGVPPPAPVPLAPDVPPVDASAAAGGEGPPPSSAPAQAGGARPGAAPPPSPHAGGVADSPLTRPAAGPPPVRGAPVVPTTSLPRSTTPSHKP
ncbi:MAG TPA: penicillin-binding transpeptidase domain-containing protein, partial [Acidimicrobiales bacterium]|nr:penicillin-binding transpeptidase domain-containing protein [Acidimicrobiales bacterium]